MPSSGIDTPFYVIGGTLRHDAPCYVERHADRDLYTGLHGGEFCYVLTSRQMGKSSLMVRTAARLRQEGVAAAVLDLTAIGQNLDPEQWYDGLLSLLARALELEDALEDYWLSHERLGPLQRWMHALRDVVLARIPGTIVLFIDEIDAVRSLPFSVDEFFAAIRECHNRRTEDPEYRRLTFCLLGVATPSDLIRDTRTTPFNIGRRIELNDFSEEEAALLAAGFRPGRASDLPMTGPEARALMNRVLHWTAGHPYLTQRLCQAVARDHRPTTVSAVDLLCDEVFLSPSARETDDNLLFVRERLLRSETDVVGLLTTYERVRAGRRVANDETNPLVSVLRLSGIVRVAPVLSGERDGAPRPGDLAVRNRIYGRVFDPKWIATNMPGGEIRRQRAAFRRGVARASLLSGLVVLALAALGITAKREADDARRATALSRRYAAQMDDARKVALNEAARARHAEADLSAALRKSEERRKEAARQKQIAGARQAEAESARFETSEKLRDSYLAQAQASRWSGRIGQKFDSLAALAKAAAFPASAEFRMRLRNEAIACMALPIDLRLTGRRRVGSADMRMLAIDDRGRQLARVNSKGGLSVRRTTDGRETARFPSPGVPLYAARFAPGGRHLLIAWGTGVNLRVAIWDLRNRSLAWRCASQKQVSGLRFSLDGTAFFVCFTDKTICRHDLATGAERTLGALDKSHPGAWISPYGNRIAYVGQTPNSIHVSDTDGHVDYEIMAPSKVTMLAWSKDGNLLAAAGMDHAVSVWDMAGRRLVSQMRGHLSLVARMDFLHNGSLLATSGWDGSLRFWDVQTGRQVLNVHNLDAVYQFSGDERRLWLAGTGVVQAFDIDDGMEFRTFAHRGSNGYSVDFMRDSSLMVTGAEDGVRFWDVGTGSQAGFISTGSLSHALLPANGGCLVLYGQSTNRLTVRPVRYEKSTNVLRIAPPSASLALSGLAPVRCSADGRRIICGHGSSLSVFDLPGLSGEKILQPHPDISTASLSPDGRWAASGGYHAVDVKVWDATTSTCAATLPTGRRTNVVFGPNGKWLITGSRTKYRFWRVGSWSMLREIPRDPDHGGLPGVIAFTQDGCQAALAHSLNVFHLIDTTSGSLCAQFESPDEQLLTQAAAFSPDGAYFAYGTESGLFFVWDLRGIRGRLARMGLDWNAPRPAPPTASRHPLRVVIDPDTPKSASIPQPKSSQTNR
jgi:WD40 repeat protein